MTRIHIAAALLVRDGRALLVHRRPERAAFPDCWGLPGGHVEPGELPHQAVSRECIEELGTQICQPQRIPMTVEVPDVEMHGFLVTRWIGEPMNVAPEEHDDMRWFLPIELRRLSLAHPESLPDLLTAVSLTTHDHISDDSDMRV